ncbi:MAG: radical SAM family heme chaperone HemW [Halieaceae bacterium]|nr:radical SAM family heme chaperone HemW [Halieaceae bacterium]
MPAPSLSVYVHLPWCERKCPYCDFNSHESVSIPERAYVDALIGDLDAELALAPWLRERSIISVFIGGGTPSLFSVEAIGRLIEALRSRLTLAEGVEVTMEANPGSTERARLAGYVDAGVSRFSLGVQSFDDACLRALGRVHDARDARLAVDAALGSGASRVNIDLMHGLPGQDLRAGLGDLEVALASGVTHISWYQLTIEQNTRFYAAPPALPKEEVLAQIEELGSAQLRDAGFSRYEVSAWAVPGQECRHNLNYWRFGDYLALGAGAHGKLSDPEGRVQRYRKTRQPDAYLGRGGGQRRGLHTLTESDLCGEFMLGALRLSAGFERGLFEAHTGLPYSRIAEEVGALIDAGLMLEEGDRLRPSARGFCYLDDLVGRFFGDDELIASERGSAGAQAV